MFNILESIFEIILKQFTAVTFKELFFSYVVIIQ